MTTRNPIALGLMGLGVVGGGVARVLQEKNELIEARLGRGIRVKHALVRDLNRHRSASLPPETLTTDPAKLLDDPETQIVVEVMGGEFPALDYILAAIRAGKHVVTANKEVMAKHGPEIFKLAKQNGISVRFEASVGGGIPIIEPLLNNLLANNIVGVSAIINGTTNYMLTCMEQDQLDFEEAMQRARTLGYAEADPSNDVEGLDAAYKLAILASLAFHTHIDVSDVYYEGITKLSSHDFRYAAELGYAIKLLAIGRRQGSVIQARVHPVFLPVGHPLAKVDGVLNAVELQGDLVGQVLFQGRGAGDMPTASAVVGDVLEIAGGIVRGGMPDPLPSLDSKGTVQAIDELETQYYLRLLSEDRPGVMAQVAHILGELEVSLASVIQKKTIEHEKLAEIVITTHLAKEAALQQAVQQLANLDVVREVSNLVRIEERSFDA